MRYFLLIQWLNYSLSTYFNTYVYLAKLIFKHFISIQNININYRFTSLLYIKVTKLKSISWMRIIKKTNGCSSI